MSKVHGAELDGSANNGTNLSSLESVKSPGDIGYSQLMSEFQHTLSNSLWLDFGHVSYQRLPLLPLTHVATVNHADYECIVQLLMEAILLAPNARQNLHALITTQLPIAVLHVTLDIRGFQCGPMEGTGPRM